VAKSPAVPPFCEILRLFAVERLVLLRALTSMALSDNCTGCLVSNRKRLENETKRHWVLCAVPRMKQHGLIPAHSETMDVIAMVSLDRMPNARHFPVSIFRIACHREHQLENSFYILQGLLR